jgi:hypothetical protein
VELEVNSSTGRLDLVFRDNSGTITTMSAGDTVVNDGNWHHVAFTYYGATNSTSMFVDGQKETLSGSISYPSGIVSANIRLNVSPSLDPSFDNFRFYDRGLTDSELQETFSRNPNLPFEPDIEWKMEDGSGTTVVDTSSGGTTENGTLIGTPVFTDLQGTVNISNGVTDGILLSGSDVDGDNLRFTLLNAPDASVASVESFNPETGAISITGNSVNSSTLSYQITDDNGGYVVETMTINVV